MWRPKNTFWKKTNKNKQTKNSGIRRNQEEKQKLT